MGDRLKEIRARLEAGRQSTLLGEHVSAWNVGAHLRDIAYLLAEVERLYVVNDIQRMRIDGVAGAVTDIEIAGALFRVTTNIEVERLQTDAGSTCGPQ